VDPHFHGEVHITDSDGIRWQAEIRPLGASTWTIWPLPDHDSSSPLPVARLGELTRTRNTPRFCILLSPRHSTRRPERPKPGEDPFQ